MQTNKANNHEDICSGRTPYCGARDTAQGVFQEQEQASQFGAVFSLFWLLSKGRSGAVEPDG